MISQRSGTRAYTMPETMVVLAIIGILTALAVSMIASIPGNSANKKDMRNARLLASLAASAIAAGDESLPAASSETEAVRLLIDGITIEEGLSGMQFQARLMTDDEIERVVQHLVLDSGILFYRPDGG